MSNLKIVNLALMTFLGTLAKFDISFTVNGKGEFIFVDSKTNETAIVTPEKMAEFYKAESVKE